MNDPFISVIVPTYNSERTIRKCVESLLNIAYASFEIIIVDDGSRDATKQVLFEYEDKIQVIESGHVGPSRCRNIASERAKGDYLAFTDSDCIVERNWLKELLKGFSNDKVVGVGGIQLSPSDETNFGKRVQDFFELTGMLGGYIKSRTGEELTYVQHNPSCNVMYLKSAFLEIGGFDINIWPSEDVDLDFRLKKKGFAFMFNPKAIVFHYRAQSIKQLMQMMYQYGATQGILARRYGLFRRIQFVPITLLLLLIMTAINYFWMIGFLIILYFYILFKLRSIFQGGFVFFLCLASILLWNFGFLKGLLNFKQ